MPAPLRGEKPESVVIMRPQWPTGAVPPPLLRPSGDRPPSDG